MSYRKYLMPSDMSPSVAYEATAVDSDTDLISRQAALVTVKDALMAWSYMPEWRDEKIIEAIAEMPPAQPEQLGTNLAEVGMDCISRQAAIEALSEYGNGRAVFISVGEAIIRIEQLPPAQPETTRRIVGKSKGGMTLWYECEQCREPVDAGDRFCRSCGRRFIKNHG